MRTQSGMIPPHRVAVALLLTIDRRTAHLEAFSEDLAFWSVAIQGASCHDAYGSRRGLNVAGTR